MCVSQPSQATAVPVPQALLLCTDATVIGTPFFVMSYVDGVVYDDPVLPNCTPQYRTAAYTSAVDALVALHKVCHILICEHIS
jgi:acyl-CoA dehydrogenase